MYKNLTTLYDNRVKKIGFIAAGIMIILDISTYLIGDLNLTYYNHHLLFHYIIILSLVMVITSRDKVDDELSKQIRYSVFKITLPLVCLFAGIGALILSVFDIEQISTLIVLYLIEAVLLIHIILYHIGYRRSPAWLLSEKDAPDRFNRMAIGLVIAMIACVVLIILLSIIAHLTGEI